MMVQQSAHPSLLTRRQAAAYLGVSVTTIDRMIARQELEAVRLSRNVLRIPVAACDETLSRSSTIKRRRRRAS